MSKIKAFLRLIIQKINSLERKSSSNYYSNPFFKPYANTFVWVDNESNSEKYK